MRNILFAFSMLMSLLLNGQILITEIMYNPPESGTDSLEYLELFNNGSSPVNLEGWNLPEGVTHTFGNVVLNPQAFLILCVNRDAYLSVFGPADQVIQWTSGALNNSGEAISLANAQGNVVFRVVYSNAAGGWYREADGNGASIELCNFSGDPNDVRKWRPSERATGISINGREIFATPAQVNSTNCNDVFDVEVNVGNFFFDPQDITIDVGQTVRWTNTGGSHNVNGSQSVFPANPESFSSGNPSSSNWQFSFTFNTSGFYRYQCDSHAGTMRGSVLVRSSSDPYPLYSIGDLRVVNSNGEADSSGVKCSARGLIYGVNQRETGVQMTVIDYLGDGIGIFTPVNVQGISLMEGDSVRIWGTVTQFRGLLQMNLDGIEVLSRGNALINPLIVTALNEETENRLIQLQNLEIVNPAEWDNNPNGFNVNVRNSSGNIFTMRIARNVSITILPSPGAVFNLTGIGGQFSSNMNPPWLDGYQILPRYNSDVDILNSVKWLNPEIRVQIYPNPVQSVLHIRSEVEVSEIKVIDPSGRILISHRVHAENAEIDLSRLSAGVYALVIMTSTGSRSMSFIRH
jgi:plastocyanin